MRKFVLACLLSLSFVNPACAGLNDAFRSRVPILEKAEVSKLSDDKIVDAYLDVLVEIEAIRTFHTTSGFTPKQYDDYRDLLRYRLRLLMEINTRNLEVPQSVEF